MPSRGRARSVSPAGAEAARLLSALAGNGAYAFPDPIEGERLILRGGGAGVSVGNGRFAAEAGEALVAADLALREPGPRARLTISEAGRARLRRGAAPGHSEGAAFLAQHLDLEEAGERGAEGRLRDASESPLAWMARRRGRDGAPLIDGACFEAGERLRRDLEAARMMPRMGTDWTLPRVDGCGPSDPAAASDRVVGALARVRAALDAVGGDLAGLLIDLCGHLKGLERIEAERRWPARSAKVVARIALGRLAEHYGLEREASGPERARGRLWRARR
ncbi:DUF6456 domain-containing protein [Methylobacterium durans]|uniref:ATPase n=1 Tax=Methylobacterium durans TaxID=2202825 RepID=A0A2U8W5R2_9HYPH|nr:DUF6456 domain-containing protein [Methylobacterium durans]AWN40860.1 ATPase [Methylobacterium durans]